MFSVQSQLEREFVEKNLGGDSVMPFVSKLHATFEPVLHLLWAKKRAKIIFALI
jgi:hypothetical protein